VALREREVGVKSRGALETAVSTVPTDSKRILDTRDSPGRLHRPPGDPRRARRLRSRSYCPKVQRLGSIAAARIACTTRLLH